MIVVVFIIAAICGLVLIGLGSVVCGIIDIIEAATQALVRRLRRGERDD